MHFFFKNHKGFNYLPKIRGHTRNTVSTCMTATLLCQHRQRAGWTEEQRRGSYCVSCSCSHDVTLTLPISSISSLLIRGIHYIAQNVILEWATVGLQLYNYLNRSKDSNACSCFWSRGCLVGKERPQQVSVRQHMTMDESLSCRWPFPQRLRQLTVFISDSLWLRRPCKKNPTTSYSMIKAMAIKVPYTVEKKQINDEHFCPTLI